MNGLRAKVKKPRFWWYHALFKTSTFRQHKALEAMLNWQLDKMADEIKQAVENNLLYGRHPL